MLITFEASEDAIKIRDQIGPDLPSDTLRLSTGSKGFDGSVQSDLLILAVSLSPLFLRKLAELLMQIVQAKGQRQVSINGATLKGYSVDEIVEVLEHAKRLSTDSMGSPIEHPSSATSPNDKSTTS